MDEGLSPSRMSLRPFDSRLERDGSFITAFDDRRRLRLAAAELSFKPELKGTEGLRISGEPSSFESGIGIGGSPLAAFPANADLEV